MEQLRLSTKVKEEEEKKILNIPVHRHQSASSMLRITVIVTPPYKKHHHNVPFLPLLLFTKVRDL